MSLTCYWRVVVFWPCCTYLSRLWVFDVWKWRQRWPGRAGALCPHQWQTGGVPFLSLLVYPSVHPSDTSHTCVIIHSPPPQKLFFYIVVVPNSKHLADSWLIQKYTYWNSLFGPVYSFWFKKIVLLLNSFVILVHFINRIYLTVIRFCLKNMLDLVCQSTCSYLAVNVLVEDWNFTLKLLIW